MLGENQKEISEFLLIEISDDKMSATLIINEPDPEIIKLITPLKILNILDRAGIKYGLKKDLIEKIINEQKWNEKFIIAEGKLPTAGDEAKLEFYFQTEKSLKPKIKEDGHVDYKEVCNVNSIEKDEPLLKKIPATKGNTGKNVEGNEIPAQMGKDIPLTASKGTYWDTNNPTLLKASEDGIVFYNNQKNTVEVHQVFVVQGSVNYSTGNINVKSSVDVKGDVKPGFTVITPYNLMVKGVVEHAKIACEGFLKVGAGIIGDDKEIINVGGDIHSGYINNQRIICSGSIYVSTEIRNAYIECENEITLTKANGIIIGGHITAANKITSGFIGNAYGVPTEIIVGINPKFRQKLFAKQEEKNATEKLLNEIIKKITYIAQHSPVSVLEARLSTHKKEWEECCKKFEDLKKEVAELETAYYNTNEALVMVTKTIYPGAIVKIKQAVYEVKEEISQVKFILEENEVAFKKLK